MRKPINSIGFLSLITVVASLLQCEKQAPQFSQGVYLVNMIPYNQSAETNLDGATFLEVNAENPKEVWAGFAIADSSRMHLAPNIVTSLNGGIDWITPSQTSTPTPLQRSVIQKILFKAHSPSLNSARLCDGNTRGSDISHRQVIFTVTKAAIQLPLKRDEEQILLRIPLANGYRPDEENIFCVNAQGAGIYLAYIGRRGGESGNPRADLILNHIPGDILEKDALDTPDLQGKLSTQIVLRDLNIPGGDSSHPKRDRFVGTIALAIDPTQDSKLYLAWAELSPDSISVVGHIRYSSDNGKTWSQDVRTIRNVRSLSLAITDAGIIGLLYQKLSGSGLSAMWETHLEQAGQNFAYITDTILSRYSARVPAALGYRYLGNHTSLHARGGHFYGTFAASNFPDVSNFPHGIRFQRLVSFDDRMLFDSAGHEVEPSIDPFFLKVKALDGSKKAL